MLNADSSVFSPIVVFSFLGTFRIFRLYFAPDLQALANWPLFPQLFHVWSNAGQLCVEFQVGALQNLHALLLLNLSFRLGENWSTLWLGSSVIPFPPFDINASYIVIQLFFSSYGFCFIISIAFFFSDFFFNILSWSFILLLWSWILK